MSHDSSFPDSPEAPESRTDRALEAIAYDEKAGLGLRRRDRSPIGDPYAEPERYEVGAEPTSGELWAGIMVGVGIILGVSAILYKPLLLGTLALVLVTLGSLADGEPSRMAKFGIVIAISGFLIGMMMAIFLTHTPLF